MVLPNYVMLTFLLIIGVSGAEDTAIMSETNFTFNPCCSFPCLHGGICTQMTLHNYECDCTRVGYHGKDCHIRNTQSENYPARFNSKYDYITFDSHFDHSYITRILPQVPVNCPTPMGVIGPKVLPDEGEIFDKLFLRRRFKPDPYGTNLLFLIFMEHLSFMLFKGEKPDGYNFSKSPTEFDSDHIYGKDEATRRELRTLQGGRLKTSSVNDEIYPPLLASSVEPLSQPVKLTETTFEADICTTELRLLEGETGILNSIVKGCVANVEMNYPMETDGPRFALAHPQLAKSPFLLMFSTIWIREHNRVADIIAKEHPDWDDERLYQVSRLIITGELIQITITDYLKQLTQYNLDIVWDPSIFQERLNAEQISIELHQLKQWHALLPDCIKIGNITYNFTETFHNTRILTKDGLDYIADILSRQQAGKVTYRNYAEIMRKTVIETLAEGRKYRLQSFNNYRKHYGLDPYNDMFELCEDAKLAKSLETFYGDINAVEFFVGMAVEKQKCSVLPPTQLVVGGPYIMKSILASPINSPAWWKPSTFGGSVGYKIVSDITLRGLFCLNMKSGCKGEEYISFRVPSHKELMEEAERKRRRLWCLDEDEIAVDI